ncbi:hypothetical protein AVEN_11659-1 [Araneus ventricosus]|uniref:Uncharacterized protein n=1 Tax=Araneus ventricosus TaxID=182803 RepID=A0A4Y2VFT6_ARAVE|nr:hypothetical protein AVEN_11659-1 [Araneus ventricosus]
MFLRLFSPCTLFAVTANRLFLLFFCFFENSYSPVRCAITANRLFLCSSVSSALLSWPRCAITLPIVSPGCFLLPVSSALHSPAHVIAMSDSRLFLCSSVSSALLFWPVTCHSWTIGGFFLLQFQQLSFHRFLIASVTGSIPVIPLFLLGIGKSEMNKEQKYNFQIFSLKQKLPQIFKLDQINE